jgi:hypothetical protein
MIHSEQMLRGWSCEVRTFDQARCSRTWTWSRGVRRDHPLRVIREIANAALADLNPDLEALYPPRLGRPSIPPERLLRAMLLEAFYGIRSERQLMVRMEFDLLFRWFVGLGWTIRLGTNASFTTNRDRLLGGQIAAKSDHFSVDGRACNVFVSTSRICSRDDVTWETTSR